MKIIFRCCGRDTFFSPVAGTSVKDHCTRKGHSENGPGSIRLYFPQARNGTRAVSDFPAESLDAQGPFREDLTAEGCSKVSGPCRAGKSQGCREPRAEGHVQSVPISLGTSLRDQCNPGQ